jgi:hypothetical protein
MGISPQGAAITLPPALNNYRNVTAQGLIICMGTHGSRSGLYRKVQIDDIAPHTIPKTLNFLKHERRYAF